MTPDDVRDVACEITAGGDLCRLPELREIEPDLVPTVTNTASGGGGGLLLVVLLVAALVVAVAWLGRSWWAGRDPDGTETVDDDLDEPLDGLVPAGERILDHETPPDRWRRRAQEHRDAGRFRDAVRCEYRSLVGELARAGVVDEIPGRTSGEERRQIAELAPLLVPAFDGAADRFDIAWFDDAPVTADDDAGFVRHADAVRSGLRVGAGAR